MFRTTALAAVTLLALTTSGCDLLEVAADEEEEELVLNEAVLTGKILRFNNPSPNTSVGETGTWEYTFQSGTAFGCNEVQTYRSTGWSISGSSIRVDFGGQFENYELLSVSGTLQNGTLRGDFFLTSSVPGNEVNGSFRQVSSSQFC